MPRSSRGTTATWVARVFRPPHYKRLRICYARRAPRLPTRRREQRHGQGSDAQQQGKEETEGRQEHQERRRDAVAVLVRQDADAGRAKPLRQEELRYPSSPRNGFAVVAGGASQRVRAKRGPMAGSVSLEG